MNLGEIIINLRESKNITQKDLANKIGINRSVLNRIEQGTRPARDEEIKCLASFFAVSTDYLLGNDEYVYGNKTNIAGNRTPIHSDNKVPESGPLHHPAPTDERLTITAPEMGHIKKYRALDERGKKTVDTVLETQYDAAMAARESPVAYQVETIAAHNDDPDHPLTPEALASIEAFKTKMRAKYGKK